MSRISASVSGATLKPQRREAGHEARGAQHPQRILDEGVADMPQHARLDVADAAERIHQACRRRHARWH